MQLKFKIGNDAQYVEVEDSRLLAQLESSSTEAAGDEQSIIKAALSSPIGSPRLEEIVKPGEKIAIISSDITRPMPTWKVMPQLLDSLYAAGIRPEDITLYLALGSHRAHSDEERKKLAGERAWQEINCTDSNPDDCVRLGFTKRGTPIDIDRRVASADRRICLGNVEYHYFAGFSGGAKAIMPGVSTREAIQSNHRFMVQDSACAGKLEGNPVREDIEEAAAVVGVDFILNVVLSTSKEILYAAAGDVTLAHRDACAYLDRIYRSPIPERADIVLVSQGGAPKDLNLYQVQKALDNAKHAVKDGGTIILIGSCREGLGEKTFAQWLTEAETPHSLIERIQADFKLGGHKAAAIAMVLEKADIYLVSHMEPDFVKSLFMEPFDSVQAAFDAALKKQGEKATVIAMPYGGSTLPVVSNK